MSHIIVPWLFVVRGYNWATLRKDLPQSALTCLEGQIPFHNLPGKINCDIADALLF